MNKYKIKESRRQIVQIQNLIIWYISNKIPQDYYDMILIAVLTEIEKDISVKLADRFKDNISISLNTRQSIAMLIFLNHMLQLEDKPDYWTVLALRIRDGIAQLYPLKPI